MIPERSPLRILIVKLGAIGDVINTLPFLNALRDALPSAHIAWVIEKKSFPILEGHKALSEAILFPRETWVRDALRFVRSLRKARFDWVFDLQRILKSALISCAAGGGMRFAFDRKRCKEFTWFFPAKRIPPCPAPRHMLDQYLEFAHCVGVPAGRPRWDIFVAPENERRAEQMLAGTAGRPIVLNLGASKRENLWMPERWALLADELSRRHKVDIVLTGGPQDRMRAEKVLSLAVGRPVDLVGKTGLKDLACVLRRAALVISCDTGPLHLAVAMGSRVVGLYGPADPVRTGPYGSLEFVVQGPRGRGPMAEIGVEAVLAMAERCLATRAAGHCDQPGPASSPR